MSNRCGGRTARIACRHLATLLTILDATMRELVSVGVRAHMPAGLEWNLHSPGCPSGTHVAAGAERPPWSQEESCV